MKTFLELKEKDKIWIIKKSDSRIIDEKRRPSAEIFSEIATQKAREGDYNTLSFIIIKNIIYPGKIKTGPYTYMKMDGGRPVGTGLTYGEAEDDTIIQFDIIDPADDKQKRITIRAPKESKYQNYADITYYIICSLITVKYLTVRHLKLVYRRAL